MNKLSPKNCKKRVPQWQIDKMKTIIANRWEEVLQEVKARQKSY